MNTACRTRLQGRFPTKERDELIKDIEVKYPQKKKAALPTEFEITEDEEFEDEPPKKKPVLKRMGVDAN